MHMNEDISHIHVCILSKFQQQLFEVVKESKSVKGMKLGSN